ncbi:hypothetical protein NP493_541g00000 [Ridgeia piscesae]|uniref:Uncharacterized protein n=1 Tax=Ridgeia piscesae TaxID=27915 RepID=A0AAD9KW45_RIDPI|nr:hypothetical protein NP493_541g00000 [Ridgeia piscesae]
MPPMTAPCCPCLGHQPSSLALLPSHTNSLSCSLPLPGMVLTFRTVSTTMDVTPQSPLSSSMNKMDRAPFDTPTKICLS